MVMSVTRLTLAGDRGRLFAMPLRRESRQARGGGQYRGPSTPRCARRSGCKLGKRGGSDAPAYPPRWYAPYGGPWPGAATVAGPANRWAGRDLETAGWDE